LFLSFRLSHQYSICIPLLPNSCHMPCPPHPPWLSRGSVQVRGFLCIFVTEHNITTYSILRWNDTQKFYCVGFGIFTGAVFAPTLQLDCVLTFEKILKMGVETNFFPSADFSIIRIGNSVVSTDLRDGASSQKLLLKLRDFSPQANYTEWATDTCRRS
jgi:hypothetical protein